MTSCLRLEELEAKAASKMANSEGLFWAKFIRAKSTKAHDGSLRPENVRYYIHDEGYWILDNVNY